MNLPPLSRQFRSSTRETSHSRWMATLKKFLIVLVVAWAISWIVIGSSMPQRPKLDSNTQAFAIIQQGIGAGRCAEAGSACERAYEICDDQDLKTFASLVGRVSKVNLACGIQTFEEGESLSGACKGFLTGLKNLAANQDAIGLTLEWLTTDTGALGARLEARYQPKQDTFVATVRARERVKQWGWIIFFGVSILGVLVILTRPGVATKYLARMRQNT